MKRFALGCGAFLVLAAVAAVLAVGWLAGASPGELFGTWRSLQRIERAADEPALARPFEPPEDGVLREDRLHAWLAVRGATRDAVEPTLREVAASPATSDPEALATVRTFVQLARLLARAGEAQLEGLRAHEMTRAELAWIDQQVIQTLGVAVESFRPWADAAEAWRRDGALPGGLAVLDPEQLARAAREVREPAREAPEGAAAAAVPAATAALVRAHEDAVRERLPYALLGF